MRAIHPYLINLQFVVCAFLTIISLTSAFAADYYVSPQGKDSNPGTEIQPWLTIAKAADTLKAGDTVYIRGGIYTPQTPITPKNSGTPDKRITYCAYPGEVVTIDGQNVPLSRWYGVIKIVDKSFITVSGLEVINSQYAGIWLSSSTGIIVKDNRASNTYSSGIGVWRCEEVLIDGNDIRLACTGRKEVDPHFPTQECLSISGSSHVEVVNNHVHDSGNIGNGGGGEGIDVKNGSSYVKVSSNHVYNMNSVGIYVDAYKKHTHDIQISGNRVYDSPGNGIVLASEQGGLLERITVYNNVIYGNMHNGITIGWALKPTNPLKEIRVLHNTCYGNRRNGIYLGASSGDGASMPKDIVIRNNICSENEASQMDKYHTVPMAEHTVDHNLLYGPGRYKGDEFVDGNPLFVDPDNGDFHLRSGSPAIDSGVSTDGPREDFDGNMRTWGSAPDMGAFEYGSRKPSSGSGNSPF